MGVDGSGTIAGLWRVDRVAEFLAGLEEGDALCRDVDLFSRLGVTPDPGVALASSEATETADFDLVSGLECTDDGLEEGVDDDLPVASGEISEGRYFVDKVSFGHYEILSCEACTLEFWCVTDS